MGKSLFAIQGDKLSQYLKDGDHHNVYLCVEKIMYNYAKSRKHAFREDGVYKEFANYAATELCMIFFDTNKKIENHVGYIFSSFNGLRRKYLADYGVGIIDVRSLKNSEKIILGMQEYIQEQSSGRKFPMGDVTSNIFIDTLPRQIWAKLREYSIYSKDIELSYAMYISTLLSLIKRKPTYYGLPQSVRIYFRVILNKIILEIEKEILDDRGESLMDYIGDDSDE